MGITVTETSFPKRVKLTVGHTSFPNFYKQQLLERIFLASKITVGDEFSKTSKIDGRKDEFFSIKKYPWLTRIF